MKIVNLSGKPIGPKRMYGLRQYYNVPTKSVDIVGPNSIRYQPHKIKETYQKTVREHQINIDPGDVIIAPAINNGDLVASVLWPNTLVIKIENLDRS